MGIGDSDYYQRRVGQEVAAAEAATCAHARQAHRDLAELYLAKLRLIETLSVGKSRLEHRQSASPPAAKLMFYK